MKDRGISSNDLGDLKTLNPKPAVKKARRKTKYTQGRAPDSSGIGGPVLTGSLMVKEVLKSSPDLFFPNKSFSMLIARPILPEKKKKKG